MLLDPLTVAQRESWQTWLEHTLRQVEPPGFVRPLTLNAKTSGDMAETTQRKCLFDPAVARPATFANASLMLRGEFTPTSRRLSGCLTIDFYLMYISTLRIKHVPTYLSVFIYLNNMSMVVDVSLWSFFCDCPQNSLKLFKVQK